MPVNLDAAQVTINARVTGQASIKTLSADVKGLFSGVKGLQGGFLALRGALGPLGAALSIGAIAHATEQALEYADAIQDISLAAGVSAEALQELRYAGTQLGVNAGQIDNALAKFTVTLGKAKIKGDEANTAFQKLGLDPAKITDTERGFNLVLDQLRKIPDLATRNALAMEIFGKEAGPKFAQLVDKGSDGLKRLRDAARESGAVLSNEFVAKAAESNDKLEAMSMVIKAQWTQALVDLAPILLSTVELLSKMAKYVGLISRSHFEEAFPRGINVTGNEPRRNELTDAERDSISGGALGALAARRGGHIGKVKVGGKTYGDEGPDVNLGYDPKEQEEIQKQIRKFNDEVTREAERRADSLQAIIDKYDEVGAAQRERTADQIRLQEAAAKGDQHAIDALNAMAVAADDTGESVTALADSLSLFADQAARNMQDIVAGFLSGERAGESFGRSMTNMLKQLAAELAAQALLTALFNTIGGAFGTPGLGTTLFGKRAAGGPVEGGKPYLVGERGPELIVPRGSGTVIPNSGLGGSVTVVNNIDARGASAEMLPVIARELRASEERTKASVFEAMRRGYAPV